MKKRVICVIAVNILALVCVCFGMFSSLNSNVFTINPVKSIVKKIPPTISDIQKAYFFKKAGAATNDVLSQKSAAKNASTNKETIDYEKKPEYIEPEKPDINQGAIYSLPAGTSIAVGRIFFIKISLLNPQKDKIFSVTLNDSLYNQESIYLLNSKKFTIKSEDIYFDSAKNTYITEIVLQIPPAMQALLRKVEISEIQFYNSVITSQDLQNNKQITNGLPTSFDIRVVGNLNVYPNTAYKEYVMVHEDYLAFENRDENVHINVFIDGQLFPREKMIYGSQLHFKDLPKPFAVGQLFQVFCTDNDGNIVNTVSFADRYVYELTLIKNNYDAESGKVTQTTHKQNVIDGFYYNEQLLTYGTFWYTNQYGTGVKAETGLCILTNFNKNTTLYGFDESSNTRYTKITDIDAKYGYE